MSDTVHTCVNRAPDGGSLPPCPACGEHYRARAEAESELLAASVAFFRRRSLCQAQLLADLDAAAAKLVALRGGK